MILKIATTLIVLSSWSSLFSQSSDEYVNRGLLNHAEDKFENAISDYKKAIELDSNSFGAYHNLALVYADIEDYDNAFKNFDKAISKDENFALAYFNRGLTYAELGNFIAAIEDYYKAMAIDSMFYIRNGLTGEIETDTATQYADAIDAVMAIPPKDFDLHKLDTYWPIAIAEFETEKYFQAIQNLTVVIDTDSSNADAYNLRGICYNMIDEYDLAIKDFNSALGIDLNMCQVYFNRGMAYIYSERYEKGCSDLKIASKLCEDSLYSETLDEICGAQ